MGGSHTGITIVHLRDIKEVALGSLADTFVGFPCDTFFSRKSQKHTNPQLRLGTMGDFQPSVNGATVCVFARPARVSAGVGGGGHSGAL